MKSTRNFLTLIISFFLLVFSLPLDAKVGESEIVTAASPVADQSEIQPVQLLCNQVAYDSNGLKTAIVKSSESLPDQTTFQLVDALTDQVVFTGKIGKSEQVVDWQKDVWYTPIDFSAFDRTGNYKIRISTPNKEVKSYEFPIAQNALGKIVFPAIVNFFYHQRANSPQELEADKVLLLYGSDKTVDLHGGWCDIPNKKTFTNLLLS